MDTLLYIDNYFTGQPSAEMKNEFEEKISQDPVFAEEVAFYLSSRQLLKEQALKERRERFKEVYDEYKKTNHTTQPTGVIRRMWPYGVAAAGIAVIILTWSVFFKPSPSRLADRYVQENFQTLGVTMGSKEDSLQAGFRLFNEGKLDEALLQFENIANRDTSSSEAKKYAGIVSLRLRQYDKAINYFTQLGSYTQLYANPGKFYHALTLLQRGEAGDKQQAKMLLQQVLQNDLDGKETAKQLLDKW